VDKQQPLGTIMDRWAEARATATALEDTLEDRGHADPRPLLFAAVSVALRSLLIGRTALHTCLSMSEPHWTLTLRSSASRQQ
jgi:hypothetical protein